MAAKKNLKEMDVDTYIRGNGSSAITVYLGRQDTAQDTVIVDTELTVKAKAGSTGRIIVATDELTVVDGDKLGRIDFQAPSESDGGDAILVAAAIWAEADATFSATVNTTDLVFATGASEAATEKVRITSGGALGVGTPTPTKRTTVQAPTVNGDQSIGLRVFNPGSGNDTGGAIDLGFNDSDDNDKVVLCGAYDGTGMYLSLKTSTTLGAAPTEKLRVDRTGNLGIGTTGPTHLLDVNSDSFRLRTAKTPSSASDTGTQGQIAWDASYLYVCTATNTWRRVAHATW